MTAADGGGVDAGTLAALFGVGAAVAIAMAQVARHPVVEAELYATALLLLAVAVTVAGIAVTGVRR